MGEAKRKGTYEERKAAAIPLWQREKEIHEEEIKKALAAWEASKSETKKLQEHNLKALQKALSFMPNDYI